jgi:hypothetical protein
MDQPEPTIADVLHEVRGLRQDMDHRLHAVNDRIAAQSELIAAILTRVGAIDRTLVDLDRDVAALVRRVMGEGE